MQITFKKAINYLNLLSAIYVAASLIYYIQVQRIGLYVFFLSYLVEIFTDKKWEKFQFDKKKLYYFVMMFFFLLAFFYLPFEKSGKYTKMLFDLRMPLLAFSIIGLFGFNDKFKLNYFLNTFIISSVIAIFYLILFHVGIKEFILDPIRAQIFTIERIKWVNTHMIFNFYMNISLISVWYILTRSWRRTKSWKLALYIGALTLIFFILSISEGRSGFIMGILLIIGFIFFEIWKRRKLLSLIAALLIPFIFVGFLSLNKRISEKSFENEPRLFLWKTALAVIKENPLLGSGINDGQVKFDIMRPHFETDQFRLEWASAPHLDSHDQYLQTTIEFGVFGLLVLLFLYISPIFIVDKNKKFLTILILFLCAYQSVFDMFLTGPFSMLFCLLVVLLLSVENNIVQRV
jgi:O-antigen ligase